MSESPTIETDAVIALLQAELARLRDASAGAWHSYFTWFTWFFTTQIVVLSLVITKKPELSHTQGIVDLTSAALITLNLLGVIAALRHRTYSLLQKDRAENICRHLAELAQRGGISIEITPGFSNDLARQGLGIFATALLIGVIVWLYVVVTLGFASAAG